MYSRFMWYSKQNTKKSFDPALILFDLQLKLFDSWIEPILLYSCEIWKFGHFGKMHLQFIKRILSVRSNTHSFYGLWWNWPLSTREQINLRVLSFWVKLLQNEDRICCNMYQMYFMHQSRVINSIWITQCQIVIRRYRVELWLE